LKASVTQAHIHFGQRHTVGGIVVWLCQTTTNPAPASVASSTGGHGQRDHYACPGPCPECAGICSR
jgi:hypothetical protein